MRSTFNQRFRIILYWYIIIKCIHYTSQQDILVQNITEQKIQKLADTSYTEYENNDLDEISNYVITATTKTKTSTELCNNCTIVLSSPSSSSVAAKYDSQSKNRKITSLQKINPDDEDDNDDDDDDNDDDDNYEWSLSLLSSKKNLKNSHHQKQHYKQFENKQKLFENIKKDTVEQVDNDSLKVDLNSNTRNHLKRLKSSLIPLSSSSSTTTPSQLPSPPPSSPLSFHASSFIGPAELKQIKLKPKGFSQISKTQKTIPSNEEEDNRNNKISSRPSLQDIDNAVPVTTTDITNNNIFYSIFHKFSLANIFRGNDEDQNFHSPSHYENSYDTNHPQHRHNYVVLTDSDNNNKDIISNEFHFRRMKRIKRNSGSNTLNANNNKKFIPSSSLSSSSSSSNESSSVSSVKHKNNNSTFISSSDISDKSDIRYNKTFLSSSSSSLSSLSESEIEDLNKISNYQHQQYKLTTTESSNIQKRITSNNQNLNLTLNTFIDKSILNDDGINDEEHNDNNKLLIKSNEPIVIIDENGGEEFQSGLNIIDASSSNIHRSHRTSDVINDKNDSNGNNNNNNGGGNSDEEYMHGDDPRVLPSGPIIRGPFYDNEQQQHMTNDYDLDDDGMSVVYAEQHSEIRLTCDVNSDIATSVWLKNGQIVHTLDRNSRSVPDYRFIKETQGGLTITNVMLEDDGEWQCEAENSRGLVKNARPIKLVVLDRPKPPYLLIDSRRLDAGNIFVPVKENSELSLACISEGGNPKPTLTWEVLLSPGVDRHAQKVAAEVLELEEIKNEKDKEPYKINSGAKSEARLPAVFRAHHNARILCVMEHPTLKIRQNASLLLDVQYTPSFAISRTPGFGYPLREGIEVSLKCDVDSNPPSTPRWQKDDGDTPVPQTGDGFLNFTSIRREHSGWYKCTSRHLNFQYSSIGYYLSVRYDSVDVTSEPDDQEVSVAASHNPNKGQLEVQLGGAVTLQCPQGSLGCWSHLDPVTARLRGLGVGLSQPTGQFSLKDVVYQDAGTYKCIGQSPSNKKKLEVLQTVGVLVKGAPTVTARNSTPVAYPGSPLHLTVEFCANPPAYAARWLHDDRVYTPGNQYGSTVLAYGVSDLPTPFCKEARLTYVSMHERVHRIFYFIVSSPGGVAEAIFKVNFSLRHRPLHEDEEELSKPEEILFPVFGNSISVHYHYNHSNNSLFITVSILLLFIKFISNILLQQQNLLLQLLCTINVFS